MIFMTCPDFSFPTKPLTIRPEILLHVKDSPHSPSLAQSSRGRGGATLLRPFPEGWGGHEVAESERRSPSPSDISKAADYGMEDEPLNYSIGANEKGEMAVQALYLPCFLSSSSQLTFLFLGMINYLRNQSSNPVICSTREPGCSWLIDSIFRRRYLSGQFLASRLIGRFGWRNARGSTGQSEEHLPLTTVSARRTAGWR